MYKIINQLTKQEENFENRDDLLSKLEIINERMKSNNINGSYQLYSLSSDGEILQELTLTIPFAGIIDQLLENFGTSARKKKRGLLDFLAKHKNKPSQSKQDLDPEDKDNVTAQAADLERDRIAKLVTGNSELGKPETKNEVSESVPEQETVPVVKKPAQEEVSEILDRKEEKHSFEPNYEVSHVTAVDLTSEVVDSFEVQTIAYKQSIKQQIQSNEKYIKDANEEIIACQNRINELQQEILAKEEQAAKLKDLYFKIDEVS